MRIALKAIPKLYFLLLILCTINTTGQTLQLYVVKGGNIPFTFNSLTKYKSGYTYSDWTQLNINYIDSSSHGWILTVKAESSGFISESGYADIPLYTLHILTANFTIPGTVNTFTRALTSAEQTIASGDSINVSGRLTISYEYGLPQDPGPFALPSETLMGKLPDFYSTNLRFEIKRVP